MKNLNDKHYYIIQLDNGRHLAIIMSSTLSQLICYRLNEGVKFEYANFNEDKLNEPNKIWDETFKINIHSINNKEEFLAKLKESVLKDLDISYDTEVDFIRIFTEYIAYQLLNFPNIGVDKIQISRLRL